MLAMVLLTVVLQDNGLGMQLNTVEAHVPLTSGKRLTQDHPLMWSGRVDSGGYLCLMPLAFTCVSFRPSLPNAHKAHHMTLVSAGMASLNLDMHVISTLLQSNR